MTARLTYNRIQDREADCQTRPRLVSDRALPLRATYSHMKERFSATILPFSINKQRQAITRPLSK
jgi:hypothetical protein